MLFLLLSNLFILKQLISSAIDYAELFLMLKMVGQQSLNWSLLNSP